MAGSSFYVQLSSYMLLEYAYGDLDTTFISSQVKLARIQNDYHSGQMQFLNTSASLNVTQNVLNTSAVNIGGVKWAFLNTDVPVPYTNIDSNVKYTDLSTLFTSLNVVYDRVRVHILSGYQLTEIDGLIFQVYVREAQTSNMAILANNVFLNSDDRDIFASKPLLLGDRMYDRYVEFLVPSVKEVNTDFYSNPTNPVSIGYQYSSNTRGWLINSQVYFSALEISKTETKSGNLFFTTNQKYDININQEDAFSALVAVVREATDGDYFEYFPTYDGNFVSEFLSDLNAQGGDWVVINDIDVYEQVGVENLLTYTFSQVQLSGFDAPLTFRPILKYADVAVAFSIDYTTRIFNRENAFQMIRKASSTSYQPRKYGKNIAKINLSDVTHPLKVFNKVSNSSVSITGNEAPQSFHTVYLPVFYDSKTIVIDSKSLLAQGANPINPNFDDVVHFGQGDARIYLSDFESYFKFVIQQKDQKTGVVTPLNLTAGSPVIAFKDQTGHMMRYPALESTSENSLAEGAVVFKLPGTLREKVLFDNSVKNFYIVTEPEGGSETLLYTGSVDKIENVHLEPERVNVVKTKAQPIALPTSINLSNAITAESSAPRTISPALSQNSGATGSPSVASTLISTDSLALPGSASENQTQAVNIPGFSNDQNGQSVKTGVKPVATKPESKIQTQMATKNVNQQGQSSK